MTDKMRKVRLRWFEDMKRRHIDVLVMRCERLVVGGRQRGKGGLKKHWREVIRRDMTQLRITNGMTLDRK